MSVMVYVHPDGRPPFFVLQGDTMTQEGEGFSVLFSQLGRTARE